MIEKRWDPLTKGWVTIEKEPKEDFLNRRVKEPFQEERISQDYQILDNIASGIIVANLEGKITIFNKRAEQILKCGVKELIGKEVKLIPPALANLLLNTLKTGKTYHREEVHILRENILVGVSTSQFYNFRGEVVGAAMVFADLLKIKEAERSLNRKRDNDFWQRLAKCLAHEIKNPLVSISTFTQLLPKNYNDPQFRENFHATVTNDIRRLDNFVEELINLAAPLELNLQTQDLQEVVKEAINSVWGKDNAEVGSVIWKNNNLHFLKFDFYKLKGALRNLLFNAMEATSGKGSLTISTYLVREDFVEIRLQDAGEGIASENLSQVFLPFFTTKEEHLGLGLTMAKRIVEAHGGSIEVKSRLGEGSTFSVYLPIDTRRERQRDE